ncbi:hypothetical protein BCON_0189g00210 [Botryotinia convoluta]|uniref:NAD(P)-binding domain-containing protein n=1 Tax=Botryotinia convoluta TaxID=54673 RepID=A0A4Z1I009_9HELO|nr:hypothetical protein BCON_0189g00210 [Botryotinia convoluta]
MKLIIAGSTGFVATERIKQALSSPDVTAIIAFPRPVICDDFSNYSESVKKELEGADACIWLIAITPSKMKDSTLDEARKICVEYTVTGLESITQLPREKGSRPFRFIYGEAESRVIDFAQASNGTVEACIAKPGLIDGPDRRQGLVGSVLLTLGRSLIGLPKVDVNRIAATLLEQAVKGIEKETLSNEDLVRIGDKVLSG